MTEKWDLRPIYDLLIDYDPRFATRDLHVPRMWVEEGCDPLLDCVPTIEGILAWARRRGRTITSFQYFTKPIREARDKRLQAKAVEKPAPVEVEARKAKNIAWARDRKITCVGIGPAEFRWLEEYEQQHGRVTA